MQLGYLLLIAFLVFPVQADETDERRKEKERCKQWASVGECEKNPKYMLVNCKEECAQRTSNLDDSTLSHINSFYDLQAFDISDNIVKFERFRGKVVVITNVASFCGYTESHYRGLVQLQGKFPPNEEKVEIMAFPCNQFGEQEPKPPAEIALFASNKGAEFRMMQKVDVNGNRAHTVYMYLKQLVGPASIEWNFATYYVVSPTGTVTVHNGVEPMDLVPKINELLESEGESEL